MLVGLQEHIDAQKEGDIVIILHQMGNHGPAYYKRYPSGFERFTLVCATNQLNECTREEIISAYDNAILYTDAFLAKAISLLKAKRPRFETAMLSLCRRPWGVAGRVRRLAPWIAVCHSPGPPEACSRNPLAGR